MGSRSARFAALMSIGLVFCSLSPLITILTFVNFWLCRLFYGYLMVFAEERKGDLGGAFFVEQLSHLHMMIALYIVLMTGVFMQRASSYGPGAISSAAFVLWAFWYRKTCVGVQWKSMCFERLRETGREKIIVEKHYTQPELEPLNEQLWWKGLQ